MDMERGDEDDGDQEMEILVGHDHEQEMQEVFGTRVSSCRSNQRGRLKRTGFSIAIGLLEDVDKREDEKEEEQHRTGLMGLETDYRPTPLFSPEELAKLLRSYQEATGVVDEGQLELECIMCLDTFSQDNPKIRTLCNCGMNRTNFHMSCLFEWLNREANCPVCREYLFFED
ncbi:hypothetical protein KXD40_001931 [Peronospora effusa]|uniref:RING-type E3 ubiquitin transferase n=1 Tax=Peronospora effusa TaxID=542832 RepID=A0A3M6VKV0_9STRA|nr:hypothetical protein DD238_002166 [Peronospora effusa]RQM16480.1 hypothetical protein DD237_002502 [Peronospora effusa]UIZ26869.1 hypothetical protein KXD40_001931 [Peronospora effusa]